MNCPHCAGEITLAIGPEPVEVTPADVEIARVQAEHAERMALIDRGIDPDRKGAAGTFKPLPPQDSSIAQVYSDEAVAVAEADADATVAAAAVVGDALEAAAEIVASTIADDGDGDSDGEDGDGEDGEVLGDDAPVVVEGAPAEEDAPPAKSFAAKWFG